MSRASTPPSEPLQAVSLRELEAQGVGRLCGGDALISGVHHDSRRVAPGDLFVAIRGAQADGASFASAAVERGAVAVLAERELTGDELPALPQMIAADPRAALGLAAEIVYGRPTSALSVIGITGTNGKTTTAWMVEHALRATGRTPALSGTVESRFPGFSQPTAHTTPEGDEIARFARGAVAAGADSLVMEVSSHALAMHRVDAVNFRVAAFTNLSHDHLDFHPSFEAYGEAKARLCTELRPDAVVVNVDDDFGAQLAERVRCMPDSPVLWRCSIETEERHEHPDAEIRARDVHIGAHGIRAQVVTPSGEVALRSSLFGRHNLENLLVAVGICAALELPLDAAVAGLAQMHATPGRLERVDDPRGVTVLVDYAHTPDALERALHAVRQLVEGRIVVVFGCGGDRDHAKRFVMGRVAGLHADVCVATSDNPRTEEPGAILREVVRGLRDAGQDERSVSDDAMDLANGYVVIEDRAAAILVALGAAQPGDAVLIAGKGHETYQIVGTQRRHFDDREEARKAIAALAKRGRA